MCMSILPSYLYVYRMRDWCPWKSDEGFEFPEIWATDTDTEIPVTELGQEQ